MKNSEKLVWKLIDREITDEEFKELENELSADSDLRTYYQNALETDFTLSNRHHTLSQLLLHLQPQLSSHQSTYPGLKVHVIQGGCTSIRLTSKCLDPKIIQNRFQQPHCDIGEAPLAAEETRTITKYISGRLH